MYAGGVPSSLPRSVSLHKFFIAACVRANQVATTMGDYRFWRPIMVLVHGDKGMGLFELFEGLIVLLCLGQAAFAQRVTVSLNQGWELRQKTDSAARTEGKWYPAEVPRVVHTDLLRNKIIPDPFFRSNEAGLQWIENASWEYRSNA
jgi:hypothetical protein